MGRARGASVIQAMMRVGLFVALAAVQAQPHHRLLQVLKEEVCDEQAVEQTWEDLFQDQAAEEAVHDAEKVAAVCKAVAHTWYARII